MPGRIRQYRCQCSNQNCMKIGRDQIMEDFDAHGIPCFSGSCSEIYRERAFKDANFGPNNRLTSAKELGKTSLMFLVDPTLSIADMEYICDVSRKVFMNATS